MTRRHVLARVLDRVDSWPVACQVLGSLLVALAVGALAGAAWGLLAIGIELIVGGALAESGGTE